MHRWERCIILALAVSAGAAHAQSLEDIARERAAYDKAAKEWARQAEEKRKIRLEQENCNSKGTPCVAVGCERPCIPGPIMGPGGISSTQLNAITDARSAGFMRWLERGINPEGWAALLAHAPRSRNIQDRRGIRAWHKIYYRYVRSIPPDQSTNGTLGKRKSDPTLVRNYGGRASQSSGENQESRASLGEERKPAAKMAGRVLAEEQQWPDLKPLFEFLDMLDRSWLGTLKNYDSNRWNGVWPNPAEIEYNLKLQYMREWESDPPTMKHLYRDFEEYVRVQENARTARTYK